MAKRRTRFRLNYTASAEVGEARQKQRIQRRTLAEELLFLARYTYYRVGHYVDPTLEQWELAFMRAKNLRRELLTWLGVCILLERMNPDDPQSVVMAICRAATGVGELPPEVERIRKEIWRGDCLDAYNEALKEWNPAD